MLRSDRLIIVAVIVCLGLAGIAVSKSNHSQEQRYQTYRYASDKPLEIDPALSALPSANALANRSPCQNPKGKEESDLCAQWRAAKAAENSAFWAQWGFWIAVVGSSFLLWQIILTRRAVEDTSVATEAMREANRIANLAQRPWVEMIVVDHNEFEATPRYGRVSVNVKIRNRGNTPAVEVMGRLAILGFPTGTEGGRQMMIDEINRQMDMLDRYHNGFGRLVFPQSDDAAAPYGGNLSPDKMRVIMDGEYGHGQFWVGLGVRYKFADQTARTIYCYLLSTDKFGQNIPISDDTLLKGNQFTLEGMSGEYAT